MYNHVQSSFEYAYRMLSQENGEELVLIFLTVGDVQCNVDFVCFQRRTRSTDNQIDDCPPAKRSSPNRKEVMHVCVDEIAVAEQIKMHTVKTHPGETMYGAAHNIRASHLYSLIMYMYPIHLYQALQCLRVFISMSFHCFHVQVSLYVLL